MSRREQKRAQYQQVKAHVQKEEGRVQAYGWSLPKKGKVRCRVNSEMLAEELCRESHAAIPIFTSCPPPLRPPQGNGQSEGKMKNLPVPVFLRPVDEKEASMKVFFLMFCCVVLTILQVARPLKVKCKIFRDFKEETATQQQWLYFRSWYLSLSLPLLSYQ